MGQKSSKKSSTENKNLERELGCQERMRDEESKISTDMCHTTQAIWYHLRFLKGISRARFDCLEQSYYLCGSG